MRVDRVRNGPPGLQSSEEILDDGRVDALTGHEGWYSERTRSDLLGSNFPAGLFNGYITRRARRCAPRQHH